MKKRSVFVVVILLLLAVVIPTPSVSASTDATQIKKIIAMTGYLETDKIIEGKVTRAQFAQILYNLTADNPEIKQTVNVSLYSDVSKNHWAATYIKAAVKKGYMMGYLDGKFKPGNYITLQEAAYAMIKVLGYTDSDLSGNLSSAVMAIYKKAKLNTNILLEKDSKLSKNGCIYLIYNLLVAKNNAGVVYGTTKGFQMDDDGELDYLSLVETYTEGPVILSSDYTETFTSKKYTLVYKDDEKATIADLAKYDVVYYNDEIKTLWAYDTKVTGTVKEISPSKSKPTSITIGNTSYNLGTSEMKTKFSNLGSIDLGDTITILLGRDGEVVGTLSTDTYKVVQYGYVNDVSLNYVNDEDSLLAQIEISVTDFDGVNHVIVYDGNFSDFAEGNIVTMTYTSSGTQLNMATHYTETQKTISDDGKFIDYNEISNNVKIVEQTASGINAVSIDRLKGCILYSDDIYFSAYDENGELIALMLNDYTHDSDTYGIVTDVTSANTGVKLTYISEGANATVTTSLFGSTGPCRLAFKNRELSEMTALTSVNVTSLNASDVVDKDGKDYTISDDVQVYYCVGETYIETSLTAVSNLKNYWLSAYYDKDISNGGLVRIIIAYKLS